jgi:hypothetical protein
MVLRIASVVCVAWLSGEAFADTDWTGASDLNWSTPGNWNSGDPAGQDVNFIDGGSSPTTGTVTSIVDVDYSIGVLNFVPNPRPHPRHVGIGEQVEHTQPLNGSDRAGEATQQGLVGQIAPLRNARHDQVLGHEEDDVFQGGGFDPQSAAHVGGETRALGDVPLPLALTHVVEKQRQNQTRRVSDLVERGSKWSVRSRPGRSLRDHAIEGLDRLEGVSIDSIAVVVVVLDHEGEASERIPGPTRARGSPH